jgi:O-antigen ligase
VPVILTALFSFGILTLWVPGYWPVTVFQVGMFALAVVAVWRSRERLPVPSYPLVALVFAIAAGLLQCIAGETAYLFATQTATVKWATFLATFLAGSCIFGDQQVRRRFCSAILWFTFIIAIVATLQTFSSDGKVFWLFPSGYSEHVMGPILYRNHYAAFIEAVLPIALYRALRDENEAFLYSVMAAALYASVIASASRAGAALASGEILAVMVLMWIRGRTSVHAIGITLLKIFIPLAAFTGIAGSGTVWERFCAPDPMGMRTELMKSSLQMIAAHPWFGVGLGAWPTVYPHYAITDIGVYANQAHTDWLQWIAEGGVVFGVLMAGLFVWCLRAAIRTIWGLGVVAVLLHACVDYPFSRPALGSWTILIMAMLAAAQGHSGESTRGEKVASLQSLEVLGQ